MKLGKNPGGVYATVGGQVYTTGAPVTSPHIRVRIFPNRQVIIEMNGRTTVGSLFLMESPAAAAGQPIPGVNIIIRKNPCCSHVVSVGGQVYTSGGAVTDPDIQVRVFPEEPVTVVIGSTSGELVRSLQTDRLSYRLYGPSTGGVG